MTARERQQRQDQKRAAAYVAVRVPRDLMARVREAAREEEMTAQDWVTAVIIQELTDPRA